MSMTTVHCMPFLEPDVAIDAVLTQVCHVGGPTVVIRIKFDDTSISASPEQTRRLRDALNFALEQEDDDGDE